MSVFDLPTGATVYRTFFLHRHGFDFDVLKTEAEIVELKKEESRYVRDRSGFVYQLSAEWQETRQQANAQAAALASAGGRRLLEQANELLESASASGGRERPLVAAASAGEPGEP